MGKANVELVFPKHQRALGETHGDQFKTDRGQYMAGSKHWEITAVGGHKGEWHQQVHNGIKHICGQQVRKVVLRSLCRSLPLHPITSGARGSRQREWTTASSDTPVLTAAPTATAGDRVGG